MASKPFAHKGAPEQNMNPEIETPPCAGRMRALMGDEQYTPPPVGIQTVLWLEPSVVSFR